MSDESVRQPSTRRSTSARRSAVRRGGCALSELARAVGQPAPTLHRTLAVLKRRGYVRQDDETQRYGLTLKMLDAASSCSGALSFACTRIRCSASTSSGRDAARFSRCPPRDEVTYVWAAGEDEVAMRTVYGRGMPGHCALNFSPAHATRRLSCLKLAGDAGAGRPAGRIERLGPAEPPGPQRLGLHVRPGSRLYGSRGGAGRPVRPSGRRPRARYGIPAGVPGSRPADFGAARPSAGRVHERDRLTRSFEED